MMMSVVMRWVDDFRRRRQKKEEETEDPMLKREKENFAWSRKLRKESVERKESWRRI